MPSPNRLSTRLRHEVRVTRLMLADDVLLCTLPMVMFTLAATAYIGASGQHGLEVDPDHLGVLSPRVRVRGRSGQDGGRAIGRRAPALAFGDRPIRRWFAAFLFALPAVVFFFLVRPSGDEDGWDVLGTAIVAVLAWRCAVHALALRRTDADRFTHQLFVFTRGAALGLALLLWF